MSTPEIAITNQVPNLLSDADCQTLAEALAAHLPGFCAEHGKTIPTVAYYPDRSKVPQTSIEMMLLDKAPADAGGVEAYHEDENDRPDGKCFAGYLLASGGAKFTGELAVSVAFSHEVLEYLLNPRTNLVLQNPPPAPDGKTYATLWRECGDPAQGEHFVYQINGQEVWMAGYTTQEWEDPNGKPPYSLPGNLVPGPLRIGPKGYGGYGDAAGNVSALFAASCHPVIRALKEEHGRLAEAAKAQAVQAVMAHIVSEGKPGAIGRPSATVMIDGAECSVVRTFSETRAIVLDEGLYVVVDRAPDGSWALSGTPATGDEMVVLKSLVDATRDTVTVTKDPS
jgi:hypothetical protein